jgi:NCS1 family nucleobase:cation symporter-1
MADSTEPAASSSIAATHGTPARTPEPDLSPRLYNRDLAPTERKNRPWKAYNVFALWGNDVHSLGNYTFAIGLFALGLGAWQILLTFVIGSILIFLLLTLSSFVGEKTGVPFPVLSRIAFGISGAQVSALLRGIVAIVWFGIQTYLASVVLRVLLLAIAPSWKPLDQNSFLGLSTLGWVSFIALWILQVVIVTYGMRTVRRYLAFAGPIILTTMLALAVWMFIRAGGSIATSTHHPLTGGAMWGHIFSGAALWVVIYGTFVLNVCDFTRSVRDRKSIVKGNLVGIPANMIFFAIIVFVLAGAQFKINGRIITSPSDIVQNIPNTLLLILAALALIVMTVAVNLLANFVAPIYMMVNLLPKKLNFGRAGILCAIIGLVILPWNLYDSPTVINYFLGGLGAVLGPVFGVIMVDYWLVRRTRVNIPDLYTDKSSGEYHYRSGFNLRAFAALVPAALVALVLALVPLFAPVAGFSWFIGAGLAAVLYFIFADRKHTAHEVDGEEIAVPSD